jgi:hypothetical protein
MSDLSSAIASPMGDKLIETPLEHQYKSNTTSDISYYSYRRIFPLSEPTVALNGTCISEFEITPNQVFNLSKSFLEADFVFPTTGVNTYTNVAHSGFCAYINQVEFIDASGKQLVWIQYPEQYTKIVWPTSISQEEFLTNPMPIAAVSIPLVAGLKTTLLNRSNVIPTVINGGAPATSTTGALVSTGTGLEAYSGVQHAIVGAVTNGADNLDILAVRLQMPLSQFCGTLFACNKDLYFGQTTTIRITWNQGLKMGYKMVAADGTVPLSLAFAPTISNDRIRLAQQANPITAESIKKSIYSEGMKLNVPFVWGYKITLANGDAANPTPQSFLRKINKGHGQRLLRVWTAQFNTAGDSGGAYFCQNQNFRDTMFTEVWAQLDGNNLQESNLVNANGDIYEFIQQKLDKSAGGSANQYLSSAFMLNDFTPWKTIDYAKSDCIVGGLSLSEEREYSINFISKQVPNGNANNLYYMFIVCQRELLITADGVRFA